MIDQHNHSIEQVKGVTYSLDALLGLASPSTPPSEQVDFGTRPDADIDDREFANVNGIEYSLGELLGSTKHQHQDTAEEVEANLPTTPGGMKDATTEIPDFGTQAAVAAKLGSESVASPLTKRRATADVKPGNQLYFTVIYLAPGDYHRFHSPTAWVVERRRHFAGEESHDQSPTPTDVPLYLGELFSVSPYIARRLANLFVLNERVALLGRWKHGFFGMVPVGATNVGSIKVNFDKVSVICLLALTLADHSSHRETLRTNLPQRPAPPSPGTFAEATYANASTLLRGQPLIAGQEMGGFCLGSTIVLVFEAPQDFKFDIAPGQKVKVGQKMGDIASSA